MELMLAVIILVALVACWVILPAEKAAAHKPAAPVAGARRQEA